jgi:DNA-binding response OmpR family regulator
MTTDRLHGRRILVVEDSFLIAMEIADAIEAEGGTVVGPVARLAPAREAARREPLDGAVLDVRLDDELTDGLAGELVARGVPVVLATGFDSLALPAGLQDLPRLRKPFTRNAVLTALAAALKRL